MSEIMAAVTMTRAQLAAVRKAASAGFKHLSLADVDFADLNEGMIALEHPTEWMPGTVEGIDRPDAGSA